MEGWIKLHRKFLDWEWFCIDEMVKLFIYLVLTANYEEKTWRGITVKRGQLITGINSLHEKTKISQQTLRTCLTRLEKTGEITKQSTNKYTIITICNYDSYQEPDIITNKQTNKQLTINQQTTNKQLTTTKEIKERKEYIYNEFYDEQLKISERNSEYEKFIKILFGQNEDNRKLDGVLSIKNQLTFTEFLSCLEYAEKNNTKIGDKLLKIENNKKYYKDVTSLNRTLKNWLTNRFVK